MISKELSAAAEALGAFYVAAGVSGKDIDERSHESKARATVQCAVVCGIGASQLVRLQAIFDGCLSLTVESNSLSVFELKDDVASNWGQLPTALSGASICELIVRVDKRALAAKWFGAQASQFRVYFHRNALLKNLRDCALNPAELAQHFWRHFGDGGPPAEGDDIARCAVVLVADSDMLIEGPLLTIAGNDRDNALLALGVPVPVGDFRTDNLKAAWKTAAKELRWDGGMALAIGLTPAHLQIDKVDGNAMDVAELLRHHWCHVSIMWLADRVTAETSTDSLLAHIHGDRAKVDISLERQCAPAEVAEGVASLGRLAYQCFVSPFPSDRLKFARIALARAMRFESKGDAYRRLIERAAVILKDHEWQWTQFSGGKIDAYLKEERELEDRVAKAVEAFDGRIAEMIKAVSDTALASIGALIGSMIASVFGGKFNEQIFRIGLYAYAGYVLLFPGIYGLTNLVFRYQIASAGYSMDADRIRKLIGDERVGNVVGRRVTRSRYRFWICFIISVFAYIGLIAFCLIASRRVPGLMRAAQPTTQSTNAPTISQGSGRPIVLPIAQPAPKLPAAPMPTVGERVRAGNTPATTPSVDKSIPKPATARAPATQPYGGQ